MAISGNATVLPGVSGERNSDETPLGGESALALALRVGGEAASGNFIARLPADEDFGRASRSAASLSSKWDVRLIWIAWHAQNRSRMSKISSEVHLRRFTNIYKCKCTFYKIVHPFL